MQRTNITLWRKCGQRDPGTSFLAWAITVAKFEVRHEWDAQTPAGTSFGNTAKAATAASSATTGTTLLTHSTIVILMKKTVTSITAAILVLGGSGVYIIHRNNESSRARVEAMVTEIQTLSAHLGIKPTSLSNRRAGTNNSQKTVSITQVAAIYDGDNMITRQEKAILDQFRIQF